MVGLPVDAVILPVTPYAAMRPKGHYYTGASTNEASEARANTFQAYNCFLNILDYPGVAVPVTYADKEVDVTDPDFKPLTDRDRINMALCTTNRIPSDYNTSKY